MTNTKKRIPNHSPNSKTITGAGSGASMGKIEPYLGAKCIECDEPVKVGNKFCKKTYCRNKNFWRRQLTVEIEADVRADERKKVLEKISSKADALMRAMFSFKDYVTKMKEGE